MAFEKFNCVFGHRHPNVTITKKNGVACFSSSAIKTYNINKYSYIGLFYDSDLSLMAFELTNKSENNYKISLKGKIYYSISIKLFLNFYGINFDKTKTYRINFDEKTKFLIIDLNKPIKTKE